MALTLAAVDRVVREYTVTAKNPDGTAATVTAVAIALIAKRSTPTASTVWTSVTYAAGVATVTYAGPAADATGALVVPSECDAWMRVTSAGQVDAEKLERIYITAGGPPLAVPGSVPVESVNGETGSAITLSAADVGALAVGAGAGGALSGSYPNPGLNETTVDNIVAADVADAGTATGAALRAAFGTVSTTAELLAAFDGGTDVIRLQPGSTFTITAPLIPPAGTHIIGYGAIVQASASATGALDTGGWHFSLTADDITVEGVTFVAPAGSLTLSDYEETAIHITGARNRVIGCRFETTGLTGAVWVKGVPAVDNLIADCDVDGSSIAYSYAGASRTTCRNNYVINAPSRAMTGTNNGGPGVWNTDCLVADNTVIDSVHMGIEDSGWGTIIRNNRVINAGDIAISAVGTLATVEGNTVDSPVGGIGIEVPSAGMKIVGNQLLAAGISVNNHTPASDHRGVTITGNHFADSIIGITLTGGNYFSASITGNVFHNWVSIAIAIGPFGLGATITGNLFLQRSPRSFAGARWAISLEAPCVIAGNRFAYTADAVGFVGGYDQAIRPAPGSDTSQVLGNLIDGGGVMTSGERIAAVATNGATPADLLFFGNTASNGAYFEFAWLSNPVIFGNMGQQENIGDAHWSAFGVAAAPRPANPGTATGTDAAVINALITSLRSLGLVT